MKIDGYPTNVVPLNQENTQKSTNDGPFTFSDIMGKALGETSGVVPADPPANCQAVTVDPPSDMPELWNQINSLLNTLENYSHSLADPATTLKQISPLVDDLERQATEINQKLSQGQIGEGLNELAQQAVAQAQSESIKFNRGDYI